MAFSYYKTLTLAAAQSGTANSTNWPLAISLDGWVQDADDDLRTVANGGYVQSASGYDIRPYSDSALTTALTYELVNYTPSTGALEMHVLIPTLSYTTNTVIYLAFGDTTVITNGSSAGTWTANYAAVYHFGSASTLGLADATGVNTATNYSEGVGTGEMFGGLYNHTGAARYLDIGNNASLRITNNYTLSAWVNLTSTVQFQWMLAKGTAQYPGPYEWRIQQGGLVKLMTGNGTVYNEYLSTSAVAVGGWHHIAVSYAHPVATFYLDGALDGAVGGGASAIADTGHNALIGNREDNYAYFWGTIDELRVSSVVRSASWITADYNSQKLDSTFITWGARTIATAGVGGGGGGVTGLTLSGQTTVAPSLTATISVSPSLTGEIEVTPSLTGAIGTN